MWIKSKSLFFWGSGYGAAVCVALHNGAGAVAFCVLGGFILFFG